jgi:hypothetical protein
MGCVKVHYPMVALEDVAEAHFKAVITPEANM